MRRGWNCTGKLWADLKNINTKSQKHINTTFLITKQSGHQNWTGEHQKKTGHWSDLLKPHCIVLLRVIFLVNVDYMLDLTSNQQVAGECIVSSENHELNSKFYEMLLHYTPFQIQTWTLTCTLIVWSFWFGFNAVMQHMQFEPCWRNNKNP